VDRRRDVKRGKLSDARARCRGVYCWTFNAARYTLRNVIKSFRSNDTERLFNRERVKRFQAIEQPARRKLEMVNAAKDLRDLKVPPGNKVEKLEGDRAGQHGLRINDQWRVCFVWKDGGAYQVEITDYH
jgi:toxin HigB-1